MSRSNPSIYLSYIPSTDFRVTDDDFSTLEIRESPSKKGFYFFFDIKRNQLVTDFILDDRPQVATLCHVKLIKKGDVYTPRIRLWKRDKTKLGKVQKDITTEDTARTRVIKAYVDTSDCYESFWKVINFLQNVADVEVPFNNFRMISSNRTDLVKILEKQDKAMLLDVVKSAVGLKLTESDLQMLAGRKEQLSYFERLLKDREYFDAEKQRLNKKGDELMWQDFFEKNAWIFGYGLSLISCKALNSENLEQITTGASIFGGAGKRIDAIMKTRGYIGSLLFCEIKTPETPLLKKNQYRPPDVYQISDDLSGGVSQVQKTTHKAIRPLASYIDKQYKGDGQPLRVEVSTIRPKQVLLIGHSEQLMEFDGINLEKSLSFELYRKSINDVEIITYDELLQRAQFIVKDS